MDWLYDRIWERWLWVMKWRAIEESGGRGHAAPTPNELEEGQEEKEKVCKRQDKARRESELRPCIYTKSALLSKFFIIIIIITSQPQSTAGHMILQFLTLSLDPRLPASSSCQPSCANRHSTCPEDVLHYVYRDAVSTLELVYLNGWRFYGWYG
jgi:hypothetical protein